MQIVSLDNLHEMLNPFFREKKKKKIKENIIHLSSAELALRMKKVK